jgi:hypothetical protein
MRVRGTPLHSLVVSIFVAIVVVALDADGCVLAAVDFEKVVGFRAEFDRITIFGLMPDYVS